MRSKHLVLCFCGLVMGNSGAAAETSSNDPAKEAIWTVTPTLVSSYLFRGVKLAGPSFQPAIDYTHGSLSLGLWSSAALKDRVGGDSDPEIDLYGAYSWRAIDGLSVVPGFYVYSYPDAKRSNGLYSVTFEPSLGVVFSVSGIQLTPKIYYDLTLESTTLEISAALALPLKDLGTELDFTATAGTFKSNDVAAATTPAVKNWGDYWILGVSMPLQLSLHSKITLGLSYSDGRNNYYQQEGSPKALNASAGRHGAVSLSYSTTF